MYLKKKILTIAGQQWTEEKNFYPMQAYNDMKKKKFYPMQACNDMKKKISTRCRPAMT
jgi:hypothetical protein